MAKLANHDAMFKQHDAAHHRGVRSGGSAAFHSGVANVDHHAMAAQHDTMACPSGNALEESTEDAAEDARELASVKETRDTPWPRGMGGGA